MVRDNAKVIINVGRQLFRSDIRARLLLAQSVANQTTTTKNKNQYFYATFSIFLINYNVLICFFYFYAQQHLVL